MSCFFCGDAERETRPSGPGGAAVCFPCATETPEREAEAKAVYGVQLDAAAAAAGSGVVVLTADGPQPYDGRDL